MRLVIKIFLVLISLLVSIFAAEFIIRTVNPQVTYSESVKHSIDCYAHSNIVPFTLGKNYRCKMKNMAGEFDVTATLNSQGYRGNEFQIEKKKGTVRVLVIGDSMTFGWGVGDKDTYPSIMNTLLNSNGLTESKVEVINAGYVGGLSPDSFYVYLKELGIQLKPDIVIVGLFVFNDISDVAENVWINVDNTGLPTKIASCCHVVDGRIFRNVVVPTKFNLPLLRDSHLYILLIDTLQKQFGMFSDSSLISTKGEIQLGCVLSPACIQKFADEEQKTYAVLSEMNSLLRKENIPFIVALFPVDYQIYPEAKTKYGRFGMQWFPPEGKEDFIQQRLSSFLSQEKIPMVDFYPVFKDASSSAYPFFPTDAHFNPVGTKIVGEGLTEYLLDNGYIR